MKTKRLFLVAASAAVILAMDRPVSAGGCEQAACCRVGLSRRAASGKPVLRAVTLPFRALGWVFYEIFRAPGKLTELAVFGQTGERVGAPTAIEPAPPWRPVP